MIPLQNPSTCERLVLPAGVAHEHESSEVPRV